MGNNKGELEKYRERRQKAQAGEPADWGSADAGLLHAVIAAITARGGAVRFGYSRDGAAYSVGVYLGAERFTEYIRPQEDINDYLKNLAIDFGAAY